ncbi:uncharacterized protein LOC131856633 [Cryptomeria japonica]|uniref:uncharacterized protein LOC131856633 n=1 Tax=Cryptomeria japonica TaxID=3369 RepID=UPI0027DA35D8|nr:uncharacterized protein LOC131856633 [Cryptomeria japonica]
MSTTINEAFDNDVYLFSTNDNVHNHNRKKIYSLKQPIARSIGTKLGPVNATERSSHDKLDMEFLISKNARVMLTSNLWIEASLLNGALGYIKNIVYKPRSMPPEPPTYVMVKFDNYSGFPFDDHNPQIVPISVRQRGSTIQIPLRLAWALTIHKSQGLTLGKATTDIGPTERKGMTFVVVSHVKSLQGLRIMPPFTYDRYEKMKDEESRLKDLEINPCNNFS